MIGAGTIINPIIKIVTTVVILGAVYLFFVKPALDTTNDITDRVFDSTDGIQEEIRRSIRDSVPAGTGNNAIDVNIPADAEKAQKLGACVQDASGNLQAIQKCMDRYSP